ncbi:hypothetical protein [Cellulomonas chitinilytica]|uniref:hypothetical protein n=1 Tax=Cellulomonas chitinilytica TaxID=398759 RepID=UPI0019437F97|nr:hypothetical protein [Cellulomonas chitinilytica]
MTLDRRAHVVLRGNDVRVDLQVERRNGWRVAGIPLYAVGPWGVAAQPLELMKALAAEVRSRRPYGADRVLAALDRHVALVRRTPDRLDLSPFASQIKGRMARIVDELS